jgi:hypothetical protein
LAVVCPAIPVKELGIIGHRSSPPLPARKATGARRLPKHRTEPVQVRAHEVPLPAAETAGQGAILGHFGPGSSQDRFQQRCTRAGRIRMN